MLKRPALGRLLGRCLRPIVYLPVLCLVLWFPLAVASEKVVLSIGDWPPYISPDMKHNGVTSRVVVEAFARAGVEVELQVMPWARAKLMAREQVVDGTFAWSHKKERERYFLYSDAVAEYGYVFFHLRSRPFDWQTLADLKGMTVGGTLSYNYGDDFYKAARSGLFTLELMSGDILNWRKLLAGRIDLFPQDINAGYAQLHKFFSPADYNRITHSAHPLKPLTTLHVLFPRDAPRSRALRERFNKGLAALRKEGRIEAYWAEFRKGQAD
ncbi:transporter substrate-binding domain-containing protein [Marinobacteraceae bacterium S3BR75-40.1]